jgi:5'-deoxynucleotidase YfbR-like HD superfamily hydrolase
LTASLDQTTNVKVLRQFFEQYMRAQTPSAHLMHIADKLDMALQALTYEERYHINLEEFLVSATSDILQSWSRWLHPD